jgi:hypothetical protein
MFAIRGERQANVRLSRMARSLLTLLAQDDKTGAELA